MNIPQEALLEIEGTDDFSPERFDEIQVKWEAVAKRLHEGHEFHGVSVNTAYSRARFAALAAAKMREQGLARARNVGPFQLDTFEAGDTVVIGKGSEISTTHPKGKRVASRKADVQVHRVIPGYVYDNEIVDPCVKWSGTGGYWFWTKLDNVKRAA